MDMYISFKEYEEMKMTGKEKILKSEAFNELDLAIILVSLRLNLQMLSEGEKLKSIDKELAAKSKTDKAYVKGTLKKVERIAKEAGIDVKDIITFKFFK